MSVTLRPGEHTVTCAGVTAVLMPERALWLPTLDVVLVADLHWGKAAAFRAANVPIPTGTTAADLERLSRVLHRTNAGHMLVLGDLLHARHGRHADTMSTVAMWRTAHAHTDMTLVRGNHDVHAGDPPPELHIRCVTEARVGPFVLQHEPIARGEGYVLAGHLHPHVTLSGRGLQRMRLPCFVFGPAAGVLPAFSSFTGGGMYERADDDALFAIADDVVLPVPPRR